MGVIKGKKKEKSICLRNEKSREINKEGKKDFDFLVIRYIYKK